MSLVTRRSAAPRAFVGVQRPGRRGLPRSGCSRTTSPRSGRRACEALLLTAEGARDRAGARRGGAAHDDFLLLTEPELGERVRARLVRYRFAAKCEIEPEEHVSTLVARRTAEGDPESRLRRARVEAARRGAVGRSRSTTTSSSSCGSAPGRRVWGREIDDRVLPAEAGPRRARGRASRRAAIRVRSRSRGCTTAAT